MEVLVPYAGTNRIRSTGVSQPIAIAISTPTRKWASLEKLIGRVKRGSEREEARHTTAMAVV